MIERANNASTADNDPEFFPHTRIRNMETTRKFPRTLREAFQRDDAQSAIGITGPVVIPTKSGFMARALARMDAMTDDQLRSYVARFMLALIVAEIAFVVWMVL